MRFLSYFLIFLLASCATKKNTSLYSSIAGVIAGGFIGKALSPNRASDDANVVLGSLVGGISSYYIGKKIYNDQNPEIKMENSPINNNHEESFFPEPTPEKIIVPPIKSSSNKKFLKISGDKADLAPKVFLIEHEAEEQVFFGENGKKIIKPNFKFYEFGVEQ